MKNFLSEEIDPKKLILKNTEDYKSYSKLKKQVYNDKKINMIEINSQLTFLISCLTVNPKSFEAWNHRRFLMKKICEQKRIEAGNLNSKIKLNLEIEKLLIKTVLSFDQRNFKCWSYLNYLSRLPVENIIKIKSFLCLYFLIINPKNYSSMFYLFNNNELENYDSYKLFEIPKNGEYKIPDEEYAKINVIKKVFNLEKHDFNELKKLYENIKNKNRIALYFDNETYSVEIISNLIFKKTKNIGITCDEITIFSEKLFNGIEIINENGEIISEKLDLYTKFYKLPKPIGFRTIKVNLKFFKES